MLVPARNVGEAAIELVVGDRRVAIDRRHGLVHPFLPLRLQRPDDVVREGGSYRLLAKGGFVGALASMALVLDTFDAHVREVRAALVEMTDGHLLQPWALRRAGRVVLSTWPLLLDAGVYLVVRSHVLFELSGTALTVVLVVGAALIPDMWVLSCLVLLTLIALLALHEVRRDRSLEEQFKHSSASIGRVE